VRFLIAGMSPDFFKNYKHNGESKKLEREEGEKRNEKGF
jgi:hypothetical protein